MPDVEGHPIVAKLGRLAGSPTLPPPQKPNTCTQASLQRCSQAKGPTKKKAKKARGRNLRLDRRSSSGGTDGPPEAASGSHGPPEAASGSRNRPTSYPTYVCLLFIYIYICMYMCVFRAGHHNPCRHSILKKLRPRSRQRHPARGRRPKDRGRVLRLRVWWLHQQPHNRAEVSRVWGLPPPKLSGLGGSNPL